MLTNHGSMLITSKNQQSSVWDFEDDPYPTKVEEALRRKWLPVSSAKMLMWRRFRIIIVGRNFKNESEMTDYCAQWQCELSHISSNQRLKSSALQPWQCLLFISEHRGKTQGQRFLSPEDAIGASTNHVLKAVLIGVETCFDNFLRRMQKCINHTGRYFEKQKNHFWNINSKPLMSINRLMIPY